MNPQALPVTTDPAEPYVADLWGKKWEVDAASNRIQFLDSRFYQAGPGVYVPSVTTILEAYPKGAQYAEWLKKHGEDADAIRDEAGRRGSVVHSLTEDFDRGNALHLMDADGGPRYKLMEWAMLERYVEFRRRYKDCTTIHAIELNMASADLGYAGTLDRLMTIDGTTYLLDIKTSGAVQNAYWLQQAAYHELLIHTGLIARLFPEGEVPEIKLGILWLNAKTRTDGKNGAIQGRGWQLLTQERPTAELLRVFNATRRLWLTEHAHETPKMTTYELSHQL